MKEYLLSLVVPSRVITIKVYLSKVYQPVEGAC